MYTTLYSVFVHTNISVALSLSRREQQMGTRAQQIVTTLSCVVAVLFSATDKNVIGILELTILGTFELYLLSHTAHEFLHEQFLGGICIKVGFFLCESRYFNLSAHETNTFVNIKSMVS